MRSFFVERQNRVRVGVRPPPQPTFQEIRLLNVASVPQAFNTGPQLTHGDHRQIQRYGVTARHLEEFPNAVLGPLALANLTDDIGIHEIHCQPRRSTCSRRKSSSSPTFGIAASTAANGRRFVPASAAFKISRCSCSALRFRFAARRFSASTNSAGKFRTINCAMTAPPTLPGLYFSGPRVEMLSVIAIASKIVCQRELPGRSIDKTQCDLRSGRPSRPARRV